MLGGGSPVTVTVHDVTGRLVSSLLKNRRVDMGPHSIMWDCRDSNGVVVSPGIYFVHMKAGDRLTTRKTVLVK
jgi:hypothetical protein